MYGRGILPQEFHRLVILVSESRPSVRYGIGGHDYLGERASRRRGGINHFRRRVPSWAIAAQVGRAARRPLPC